MGKENPVKGIIRKIRGTTGLPNAEGIGGLAPLNPDQGKAYPNVIFQEEGNSSIDITLARAAHQALVGASFPIAIDCDGIKERILANYDN